MQYVAKVTTRDAREKIVSPNETQAITLATTSWVGAVVTGSGISGCAKINE